MATLGSWILYSGTPGRYGKHSQSASSGVSLLPARIAWFLQELPSFVVSVGMLVWQPRSLFGQPGNVLLGLFSAHYFHRLAFFSAERSAGLGSTSRGSMLKWGEARSKADFECQSDPQLQAELPRVGAAPAGQEQPSLSLERPSDTPNCPAVLERKWQRPEWVGKAGEPRLERSYWPGRVPLQPFTLPRACSVWRPHPFVVELGQIGSGIWRGEVSGTL